MKAQRVAVNCSESPAEQGPSKGPEPSPESFFLTATHKAGYLIARLQNENAGSLAQKMIKNFETATTDHLTSSLTFQVTTEVTHP